MLGRFLELSLVVPDPGAAWQRWLGLGFEPAEAGDIWPHAYGVVACEGVSIGLHAAGDETPCISLVRPEVAALARALADRLIGIEREQLTPDAFNLIELREPGGMLLRVQEARSFSPPAQLPRHTAAGRFLTISLPCPDLAEARGFWERLDYEVRDEENPWPALAVESLPIQVHEAAACRSALLVFDAAAASPASQAVDGPASMHVRDAPATSPATPFSAPPGIAPTTLPALRNRRHQLLRTPDGIALLTLSAASAGPDVSLR